MDHTNFIRGFSNYKQDPFPSWACTVPNSREDDVRDSSDDCYYLVLILDSRFEVNGLFQKMMPYTARGEDGEVLYGGVDRDGNFVDHATQGVQGDGETRFVVAWKACRDDFDLRKSFGVRYPTMVAGSESSDSRH